MAESPPVGPLPSHLVVDTSFLRTLGGPSRERYRMTREYVQTTDRTVLLTEGVTEELSEQSSYVGGRWLELAETVEWVERVGPVQHGVRVHDGPRAGAVIDWAHERLASLEQQRPDELRPTDAELVGASVMTLGSRPVETVGVVLDDRNAEAALATAVKNTFYENRVRFFDIWTVVEHIEHETTV